MVLTSCFFQIHREIHMSTRHIQVGRVLGTLSTPSYRCKKQYIIAQHYCLPIIGIG
jgi:hypothetical protein